MYFLTSYIRRQEDPFALILLQARRKRDRMPILFAGISRNGRFASELAEWFYEKALQDCRSGAAEEAAQRAEESFHAKLAEWAEAPGSARPDFACLFCAGAECFWAWYGETDIRALNWQFGKARIQSQTRRTEWYGCERALLEEDVGLLTGSAAFFDKLTAEAALACLTAQTINSPEQAARHLAEAGGEAARQGAESTAAVFAALKKEAADRNAKRLIGQGAFAKVYLLRRQGCTGKLACKVADTEAGLDILEKEAEALRRIDHPLFVRYVDFTRETDRAMLWMEYAKGRTLADILARQGALPPEEAVRIAAQLADGLRYLHEQPRPLLYRDLKPENICIGPGGRVKLLDLGCVCPVEEAARSLAGSRGYAAPEQLTEECAEEARGGRLPPGPYSDVYALGKLLHYMLTGQNPIRTPFHRRASSGCRSGTAAALERFALRCAEPEAARRPPDMRSVLRQLAPFLRRRNPILLWFQERKARICRRMSGKGWEEAFRYEKCICKSGCGFAESKL